MGKGTSLKDKFLKHTDMTDLFGCWEWKAARNAFGYGILGHYRKNAKPKYQFWLAHRLSLYLFGIELDPTKVVDHFFCKNRACVNPLHLRQVSQKINALENSDGPTAINAKKTHCIRGHPIDGSTVRKNGKITRFCKRCSAASKKKTKHKYTYEKYGAAYYLKNKARISAYQKLYRKRKQYDTAN